MWFFLALASSLLAALTSILAKIGIHGVNSTLATAIRTVVVLIISWGRSWLFLILSGLATGASWLCYYKALQVGLASKVISVDKLSIVFTLILAALVLNEPFTFKTVFGCILIAAGTLLMVI